MSRFGSLCSICNQMLSELSLAQGGHYSGQCVEKQGQYCGKTMKFLCIQFVVFMKYHVPRLHSFILTIAVASSLGSYLVSPGYKQDISTS